MSIPMFFVCVCVLWIQVSLKIVLFHFHFQFSLSLHRHTKLQLSRCPPPPTRTTREQPAAHTGSSQVLRGFSRRAGYPVTQYQLKLVGHSTRNLLSSGHTFWTVATGTFSYFCATIDGQIDPFFNPTEEELS